MTKKIDLTQPEILSGEKAIALQNSADKTLSVAIYTIGTSAAFSVAILISLVILQINQNSKIDKALSNIHAIAVANNQLGKSNVDQIADSAEKNKRFSGAVVFLEKQLSDNHAVSSENRYRIKRIEERLFGRAEPVPAYVTKDTTSIPPFSEGMK